MEVPKKESEGILYARGVKKSNIKFLKDEYLEYGYQSVGEFLDVIIQQVKSRIKASDFRRKIKAKTPVRRNHGKTKV